MDKVVRLIEQGRQTEVRGRQGHDDIVSSKAEWFRFLKVFNSCHFNSISYSKEHSEDAS